MASELLSAEKEKLNTKRYICPYKTYLLKRILFIVNKKAGTDEKKNFPDQVNKLLNKEKFIHDIIFTEFRGHAIELAANAAKEGVDIVAAVGGDGSVNEVARGILGTDTTLAIIPKGSGNGMARSLDIPCNMSKAITLINNDHQKVIDVGFANEHLFLSNAGVGFDALVAKLFTNNTGRGLRNYFLIVTKALRNYRPGYYTLLINGEEIHEQAFFIAAANGNQFGYNFKIAPDAEMDDGLMDICILKPVKWWQLSIVSLQSLSGKLSKSRYAKHLRCHSFALTAKESLEWMQVDGDAIPVKNQKIEMRIQPGVLKVVVP